MQVHTSINVASLVSSLLTDQFMPAAATGSTRVGFSPLEMSAVREYLMTNADRIIPNGYDQARTSMYRFVCLLTKHEHLSQQLSDQERAETETLRRLMSACEAGGGTAAADCRTLRRHIAENCAYQQTLRAAMQSLVAILRDLATVFAEFVRADSLRLDPRYVRFSLEDYHKSTIRRWAQPHHAESNCCFCQHTLAVDEEIRESHPRLIGQLDELVCCGHEFHPRCLYTHLAGHTAIPRCPICRTLVDPVADDAAKVARAELAVDAAVAELRLDSDWHGADDEALRAVARLVCAPQGYVHHNNISSSGDEAAPPAAQRATLIAQLASAAARRASGRAVGAATDARLQATRGRIKKYRIRRPRPHDTPVPHDTPRPHDTPVPSASPADEDK